MSVEAEIAKEGAEDKSFLDYAWKVVQDPTFQEWAGRATSLGPIVQILFRALTGKSTTKQLEQSKNRHKYLRRAHLVARKGKDGWQESCRKNLSRAAKHCDKDNGKQRAVCQQLQKKVGTDGVQADEVTAKMKRLRMAEKSKCEKLEQAAKQQLRTMVCTQAAMTAVHCYTLWTAFQELEQAAVDRPEYRKVETKVKKVKTLAAKLLALTAAGVDDGDVPKLRVKASFTRDQLQDAKNAVLELKINLQGKETKLRDLRDKHVMSAVEGAVSGGSTMMMCWSQLAQGSSMWANVGLGVGAVRLLAALGSAGVAVVSHQRGKEIAAQLIMVEQWGDALRQYDDKVQQLLRELSGVDADDDFFDI